LSHPLPSIHPQSVAIHPSSVAVHPSFAIKQSHLLPLSQPSVAGGLSYPKPSCQAIHCHQAEPSVTVKFFANNGIGIGMVEFPSSSPTTLIAVTIALATIAVISLLLVACHSHRPCHCPHC
jgi:hypothetical protein